MIKREYYSIRKGITNPDSEIDLNALKRLFLSFYKKLEKEGYFQKYFGKRCVDEGEIAGELGDDIESAIFINLRKEGLWPVPLQIEYYSEEDFFDMIEFLHDHCSTPIEKRYHDWGDCGWHVHTSDDLKGQSDFRQSINLILKNFKGGMELSITGEILTLPENGFQQLIEAEVPTSDEKNIQQRMNSAIVKFRKAKSSEDERRDALRDLADVLEFLRPQVKTLLTKQDEGDLFNIANNFGIRHHNLQQKTEYDKPLWHSWIFYSYLSTIHLVLRLIKKQK